MNGHEFTSTLRELVRQAQTTGACLNLTQIANLCEVNYDRLWRFTRNSNASNILLLDEAQRIYEKLTGSKLLPTTDEIKHS